MVATQGDGGNNEPVQFAGTSPRSHASGKMKQIRRKKNNQVNMNKKLFVARQTVSFFSISFLLSSVKPREESENSIYVHQGTFPLGSPSKFFQ